MAKATALKCLSCGEEYPVSMMFEGCPRCKHGEFVSSLSVQYDAADLQGVTRDAISSWQGEGVWRFAPVLPVENPVHRVSIGEGNTPLISCPGLSRLSGVQLSVKDESRNPTWSHKDRLVAIATGMALQLGARVVGIASTGNHGGSVAAYAARAGLDCLIFTLPTVPQAMSSLMRNYGAKLIATTNYGRWALLSYGVKNHGWYSMGNYVNALPTGNPFGPEGYKSIAYELCLQTGWNVPDMVFCPVGYGELIYGIWKGFCELHDLGVIQKLPKMVATEPEGGPTCNAVANDLPYPVRVKAKSALPFSIACDLTGFRSLLVVRQSGGTAVGVTDDEIMSAQALMGREGLYPEPSSATSVAGALRLAKSRGLKGAGTVICIQTSTGLKDPAATARYLPPLPEIEPDVQAMTAMLKDVYGFDIFAKHGCPGADAGLPARLNGSLR